MEPYDLHAIEIIKNIKYINIASVTSKGMPWNSPVYTAFPRRIYKFIPEKIWINDVSDIKGNFIDIRKEINLNIVKIFYE